MSRIKLLTVDEAAEALRVSKPTMYILIHSKGFPRVKIGRAWRIEEEMLAEWVRKGSRSEQDV